MEIEAPTLQSPIRTSVDTKYVSISEPDNYANLIDNIQNDGIMNLTEVQENMLNQVRNVPIEQTRVVTEYTGFGAQRLNNAIATGKITVSIQSDINALNYFLDQMVIPENIIVY